MTSYGELVARLRATAMERRIPVHATFCLTHRCNLDCLHCYLRDDRAREELNTAAWCELIDQAAELGCLWLTLTGGEPTLRPDFPEIYRHAKRRGLLVVVMTNGSLLDERLLSLFAECPPHYLDISLYAFEREPYRMLTGRDARDRVYAGVEALLARKIRVRVKTTVTRENLEEVPAIAAWAKEQGLCYRVDGDLCPTLQGDKAVQEYRISPAALNSLELRSPKVAAVGCGAAQSGFYVRTDGGVAACLLDTSVARETTLAETWDGPLRRKRRQILCPASVCEPCADRDHCDACFPLLLLEGGPQAHRCEGARLRRRQETEPHAV